MGSSVCNMHDEFCPVYGVDGFMAGRSARAGRRDLLATESEFMTLVALRASQRKRMVDRAGILDSQLAGHGG